MEERGTPSAKELTGPASHVSAEESQLLRTDVEFQSRFAGQFVAYIDHWETRGLSRCLVSREVIAHSSDLTTFLQIQAAAVARLVADGRPAPWVAEVVRTSFYDAPGE